MMRAWLYYRLSRDENEEMNSLQNQRQILIDYAEQNGYEIADFKPGADIYMKSLARALMTMFRV